MRRHGVTVSLCVKGVVTLGGVTIGYAVFFALNYDNMKSTNNLGTFLLMVSVALILISCNSDEGWYNANVKLTNGYDSNNKRIESETEITNIYIRCNKYSFKEDCKYVIEEIVVGEDSVMYVNIPIWNLTLNESFINKWYCGTYPDQENETLKICVRPYQKAKKK